MELKDTTYQLEKGVALVTLNRPQRLNAYTRAMGQELIDIMGHVDQDDAVRTVVVTGAGRAYCAGMDLGEGGGTFDYAGRGADLAAHRDGGGRLALAVYNCRKPVIAAINGPAVGVGITTATAMDMRIVAEDAKIGFVFARRGLVPEACSTWFLPRLVGPGKAAELMLTGRVFRAREEEHSGLFNQVLPTQEVLPRALEIAREIAENTAPVSVALTKAMLWHGLNEPDPQAAHLVDSRCFYWAGSSPDAAEGIQSFLEKRPPQFKLSPTKDLPSFFPWWRETKA